MLIKVVANPTQKPTIEGWWVFVQARGSPHTPAHGSRGAIRNVNFVLAKISGVIRDVSATRFLVLTYLILSDIIIYIKARGLI
jgi:hypothetical protein